MENITKAKQIIEVKDLHKTYIVGETKVKALRGVDFTVNEGEFCMIVGTSGSGKSTLLNMLGGLEKPTKGQVILSGIHMEKLSEADLVLFRQKNVGFIFQAYNLLQSMNAMENVALPLTFQGMNKKVRNQKAKKMLKMVGLEKYYDRLPSQLSGGQQQRVGIARALVVNPKIIFADEPTGNLDSKTSMQVLLMLSKLSHEKSQTIIMVTHDNYLAGFADKIIRVIDGKITENIDNRENAKKQFLEYFGESINSEE